MLRHALTLTLCCASLAIVGCRSMMPTVFNPGNTDVQRANASRHDPYTDEDLGPEVVGGRPREFQKPRPEPVRDQQHKRSRWSLDF